MAKLKRLMHLKIANNPFCECSAFPFPGIYQPSHRRGSIKDFHGSNKEHVTRGDRSGSSAGQYDPKLLPQQISLLTIELDKVRAEVNSVDNEIRETRESNQAKEAEIEAAVADIRKKRKEEENGRNSLRSEMKTLESNKNACEARKREVEKRLNAIRAEINGYRNDMQLWHEHDVASRELIEAINNQAIDAEQRAKEARMMGIDSMKETMISIQEQENELRKLEKLREEHTVDAMKARREEFDKNEDAKDRVVDENWHKKTEGSRARYDFVSQQFHEVQTEYRRSLDILVSLRERHNFAPHTISDSIYNLNTNGNNSVPSFRWARGPYQSTSYGGAYRETSFDSRRSIDPPPESSEIPKRQFSGSIMREGHPTLRLDARTNGLGFSQVSSGRELIEEAGPLSPPMTNLLPKDLFNADDVYVIPESETTDLSSPNKIANESPGSSSLRRTDSFRKKGRLLGLFFKDSDSDSVKQRVDK